MLLRREFYNLFLQKLIYGSTIAPLHMNLKVSDYRANAKLLGKETVKPEGQMSEVQCFFFVCLAFDANLSKFTNFVSV